MRLHHPFVAIVAALVLTSATPAKTTTPVQGADTKTQRLTPDRAAVRSAPTGSSRS